MICFDAIIYEDGCVFHVLIPYVRPMSKTVSISAYKLVFIVLVAMVTITVKGGNLSNLHGFYKAFLYFNFHTDGTMLDFKHNCRD